MATLIKVAERIINLDMLVFAHWVPGENGEKDRLHLVFEQGRRQWLSDADRVDRRDYLFLNMMFTGADAEFVRDKLHEILAETWQLPSGDKGHWPPPFPPP